MFRVLLVLLAAPGCAAWDGACGVDDDGVLYGDSLHAFTLDIPDPGALADSSREDSEDTPGTFSWDGADWPAEVRLKGGHSFQPIEDKPAFKVDLGEGRVDGARRLTLNNMVQDASALSERASYALYAALGVPAPRHAYACLVVNGEDKGLYSVVETLDELWMAHQGGTALYESDGFADLTADLVGGFTEEEGEADLDALVAVIELDGVPTVLERDFHPSVYAMLAGELLLGNPDGYASNVNNYLLLLADERWTLAPWGQDFNLRFRYGVTHPISGLGAGPGVLYTGCVADTACAARLESAIVEGRDTWLDRLPGVAEDALAVVGEAARLDPLDPYDEEKVAAAQDRALAFLRERPAVVAAELGI
ncbi:MAG: CotH kinase family protein [Deltaproteobacteria bacterium]|nr:CotH kinase family protein [Deltaproteobacteria bacterium]